VVGSNIFNTLLIIGAVALARPIHIGKGIMVNEIPLVILASIAILAMGCSPWLDGTPAEISRVNGILLLLFFVIFMRYIFAQAEESKHEQSGQPAESKPQPGMWLSAIMVVGGLAALIYGGDLFVDKASAIARSWGVSDAIIGLTIVAAGTSLPELATSLVAAVKGNSGIAVGNVIGSNIFNIFLVLGCAAAIRPLPFGGISTFDLGVLTGSALLFWFFGWFFKTRTITRIEGAIMALCYILYISILVMQAV
jgi:hypothetical protein